MFLSTLNVVVCMTYNSSIMGYIYHRKIFLDAVRNNERSVNLEPGIFASCGYDVGDESLN